MWVGGKKSQFAVPLRSVKILVLRMADVDGFTSGEFDEILKFIMHGEGGRGITQSGVWVRRYQFICAT